jgi:glycosyltransferase involved in cell wall biosynthesis
MIRKSAPSGIDRDPRNRMEHRSNLFIVIPAYNEVRSVATAVAELREQHENVVVVDDGSSDATASEARRAGATVLRHILNRGQGAALQTGIDYALSRGAEVIVTFDADGQHRSEDVQKLIEALRINSVDVAIGSRFLDKRSNIPWFRRIVLRVAARFMRLTSGLVLTDAHNGLRAMTGDAASKIHITLDGMAHASEIIDQISGLELSVTEVPVVVTYSEYSLRKGQSSMAAFRIAFDYLMKRWF